MSENRNNNATTSSWSDLLALTQDYRETFSASICRYHIETYNIEWLICIGVILLFPFESAEKIDCAHAQGAFFISTINNNHLQA